MSRRSITILAVLVVLSIGSSLFVTADASSSAATGGNPEHYRMVRVEYFDLSGNLPHTNTICHLINTSAVDSAILVNCYIMGHGGVGNLVAVYTGLYGTVIPPLGRIDLPINSVTIPGVTPATSLSSPTVASLVVGWAGPSIDQVRLSATIDRFPTGDIDQIARSELEGYPVTIP